MTIIGSMLNFARKLSFEQGAAELADRWDAARPAVIKGAHELIDEVFSGHAGARDDAHQILLHLTPLADTTFRSLGGGKPALAERGRNRRHLMQAFSAASNLRKRATLTEARDNWQDVQSRGQVQPIFRRIRQEAKDAILNFRAPVVTTTGTSPSPIPVPTSP